MITSLETNRPLVTTGHTQPDESHFMRSQVEDTHNSILRRSK